MLQKNRKFVFSYFFLV